jgi:hypothetical protein
VLACDPGSVKIGEVYRRFVIDAEKLMERAAHGAPREVLQSIAADVESDMAAPIESLAQEHGDTDVSQLAPAESRGPHLRRSRSDSKA